MSNTQKRVPKTLGEARAAAAAHPLVQAIVAAPDRPFKDLEVPEWPMPDGSPMEVRIRGASADAVDAYEASLLAMRASSNGDMSMEMTKSFRARFLVECLFDLDDEPIPVTAEQLGKKSARVILRLFKIAQRLSGSNEEAVEEAGKDSERDPSESSTTG